MARVIEAYLDQPTDLKRHAVQSIFGPSRD
jgi:hypothetical protein